MISIISSAGGQIDRWKLLSINLSNTKSKSELQIETSVGRKILVEMILIMLLVLNREKLESYFYQIGVSEKS